MAFIKKIEQKIINNIFYISLYMGITGVLLSFLFAYDINNKVISMLLSCLDFNFINFSHVVCQWFKIRIVIESTDDFSTYSIINGLDVFINILLLLGSLLYFISNKVEKRLLYFSFSLHFISALILFCTIITNFFKEAYLFQWMSIYYVLQALFCIFVFYVILKHFELKSDFVYSEKAYQNLKPIINLKSNRWSRLFHFLADTFIIAGLFAEFVFNGDVKEWAVKLENVLGDRLALFVIFFLFSTIYYLIFEGLFKTTPAKILTQSFIIGIDKERLPFSKILGRTLARRIPLNPFSFFNELGWHDEFSKTTVINNKVKSKFSLLYWSILMLFLAFILYNVLSYFFRFY